MASDAPVNSSSDPGVRWYTLNIDQALQTLESDRKAGLNTEQVTQRRHQYGVNELEETGGRSAWMILIDQFKNIMLLMLIAVAVVSAILDLRAQRFPKDAIAILLIVILNAVLGYLQESRAEKALAALKQLASPIVRVLRNGNLTEVEARELVPGDIVMLEAGVQVAADGLLLEASNLQIRESALTGEAHAVNKQADLEISADTPLGDRLNMVFQGTEVTQGRGKVLVTNTGMKTELGRIATLLQSVESDPTPLQQRMTQLGNVLVGGSLALVALVVCVGVIRAGWEQFEALLEVSLSMAVAVVPEGLPAVITVTLALGTQRMVRRHALIRKLPAVETLGSVTTICSDKTGTLTQNKMVVQSICLPDDQVDSLHLQVTGAGYEPVGEFQRGDQVFDPKQDQGLHLLLAGCVLCNDAVLQKEQGEWSILGDPTEGSLLVLARKAGLEHQPWTYDYPRINEFPFSSERKRMSVICEGQPILQSGSPYMMFAKGSPELLVDRCPWVQYGDRQQPIDDQIHQDIIFQNDRLASQGLRVLGFAYKPLSQSLSDLTAHDAEDGMIWLGMVGMIDAARPEAKEAVAKCRQAGIRPVMITGDHQLTARAIAQELGIAQVDDVFLAGQDLENYSNVELEKHVEEINVYARVSPEHKLRIVQALQRKGKIVAMTGDGVNDAPALKQANIGIAMGITGTDVSKEASDMVLLDDNFASIVAATEEGRVVYSNIRRFVKYILGSNIGEVLTIAASPILVPGGGVPLTPLQILWMNLVTDGVPALALAVEPADPNVMKRPPHDPQESIFARGLGAYMLRIGIVFTILSVTLMVWAFNFTHQSNVPVEYADHWKTMVFTTLCIAQMGHAIAVRSDTQLTIELNPFTNLYVWGAVIFTTLLQLMLVYVPPLRDFFGTQALTFQELVICFGFSTLMFVWVELEKLFLRWYHASKSRK